MTRATILPLLLAALTACGPRKPGMPMPEAVAELRKHVLASPALYGKAVYNPPSIPDLDEKIEEAIAKRNFGRTPSNATEARHFAETIAPGIWRVYLETPEGKAAFEARVREHWENPPTRMDELNGVIADLGLCPGALRQSSRGNVEMEKCAFHEDGDLAPPELVRRLEALIAAHPGAKAYNLSVTFPHYRTPAVYRYRWDPQERRLFVTVPGGTTYRSPRPVESLAKLASGEEPSRTRDMQVVQSNLRVGAPR